MTLEQFYEVCNSGSRIFLLDEDTNSSQEMHIDQHTKTYLYEVVYFEAEENDLIFVLVTRWKNIL